MYNGKLSLYISLILSFPAELSLHEKISVSKQSFDKAHWLVFMLTVKLPLATEFLIIPIFFGRGLFLCVFAEFLINPSFWGECAFVCVSVRGLKGRNKSLTLLCTH